HLPARQRDELELRKQAGIVIGTERRQQLVLLRRQRGAQALPVGDGARDRSPLLARCPALPADVIAERRDLRTADGVGESRRIARRDGGTMIRNGPYTVYLLH